MKIIIFDQATGAILRCVSCPDAMAADQCGAGEGFIEGDRVRDDLWRVDPETQELVEI